MPTAAMRPCRVRGCSTVGPCATHSRSKQTDERRGSASSRGYGAAWARFRPQFRDMLTAAGIVPCCGAALPDGPQTQDSTCKAKGRVNFDELHFDHEPPLTDAERQSPSIVCDPRRIQLLCGADHNRKRAREAASPR